MEQFKLFIYVEISDQKLFSCILHFLNLSNDIYAGIIKLQFCQRQKQVFVQDNINLKILKLGYLLGLI